MTKPEPLLNRLLTNRDGIPPSKTKEDIKPELRGSERYPFLFLIDVSGSTGEPPDPDIVHINQALNRLIEKLRNPEKGSDLAKCRDLVDVCFVAYSDDVDLVLDWTPANKLPAAIRTLKPVSDTCTAKALLDSIAKIGERLRELDKAKIPYGFPHIFHLTDGAIKDAKPGDPLWEEIAGRLTRIDGRGNSEKKYCSVITYITPKGMQKEFVEIAGQKMSGKDLMDKLCGDKSTYAMERGVDAFEDLVNMVVKTISNITNNFPTKKAKEAAESQSHKQKAAVAS